MIAIRQQWTSLRCHGYYGSPPSWRVWWMQLLQWCTVLIIMKFFVGVVLYAFSSPLGWVGSLLFYPVHNHPKIELLIVMIGCPLVMNMVQFWIQDSFLMDHEQQNSEELPLLNTSVDGSTPVQKPRGMSNVSSAADMRTHPGDVIVRTG
ncbi:Store-operated calcium entry regulator STIMATE [Phytophthora citrophthora]|uniref:Store-operated calcium entry regulator STIMATE n=1 Tax=Phytophthora citrophthora TaxID=4793 RepID=A0AAD9GQZ7_9STRA|nr:Store-operated calcium entry regulator STIMATE [Phytophthora citrophthora]